MVSPGVLIEGGCGSGTSGLLALLPWQARVTLNVVQ